MAHERPEPVAASPALRRWFPALCWAYSLLLVAVSRTWTARSPGIADAELFAYIGREWHGGVMPYTQLWDDKPPGILAVNWLAAFSQRQFAVLAGFEMLALFATLFLVSRMFKLLDAHSPMVWLAPFIAASTFAVSGYSLGGNYTEIYLLPLAALSIYAFLRGWTRSGPGYGWYLLAGVAAGLAAVFKPVGMSPLLAATAFLLLTQRRPLGARLSAIALSVIGFVLVWGLVEAGFAGIGAARMMFDATLVYNLHYGAASHTSIANKVLLSADRLLPISSVLGLAVAALLLWLYTRMLRPREALFSPFEADAAMLFLLWAGADICGANAGGRYYPHYFLPALLSLSALACLGLLGLLRQTQALTWRPQVALGCALLLPVGLMGMRGQLDQYHAVTGNAPYPWQLAATYIRDHKLPQDTLFTWEFTPGVYRVSEMHGTTRYASAHYIKDFPAAYQEIGGEILSELKTAPPTYVIYDCNMHPVDAADTVRVTFLSFVAKEYRTVYKTGNECVAKHD